MTFGYARVSRVEQNLDRQLDLLKNYTCDEILMEKMSGSIKDRPELDRLLDKVRDSDTVIVESFSRLGRSTKNLLEIMENLENKNVKVVSHKENFDTRTPHGKLMLTIFQAFSQFERDLIRERTFEGLASARARGRCGGRPKVKDNIIDKALKMYDSRKFSISDILQTCKISSATLYRSLERLKTKR